MSHGTLVAEAIPAEQFPLGGDTRPAQPASTGRQMPGLLLDPLPSAQVRELLARPDIAALAEQARTLDGPRRVALSRAWQDTYRQHGRTQIHICHRISRADPANFPHHASVRALVWQVAAVHGDQHQAAAASDAAFVLLTGDLLDDAERAIFEGPWRAVLDAP